MKQFNQSEGHNFMKEYSIKNQKNLTNRQPKGGLIINKKIIKAICIDKQDNQFLSEENKFNITLQHDQKAELLFNKTFTAQKTYNNKKFSNTTNRFFNFNDKKKQKRQYITTRQTPKSKTDNKSKYRQFITNNIINSSNLKLSSICLTNPLHSQTQDINIFKQSLQRKAVEINKNGIYIQPNPHFNHIKVKSIQKRKASFDVSLNSQSKTRSRRNTAYKMKNQNNLLQNSRLSEINQSSKRLLYSPVNFQKLGSRKDSNISQESNSESLDQSQLTYEEQMEKLTKKFLAETQKLKNTKKQLRRKFREKIINANPIKQKNHNKKLYITTQDSTKLKPPNLMTSNNTISNHLTATQVIQYQEEYQSYDQKNKVNQMLNNAYFWSRSKKKKFYTDYQDTDEYVSDTKYSSRQIWNYNDYIKHKTKSNNQLTCKIRIKVQNLLKFKDKILRIEQQGSKQQQYLKECLEDAIESCLHSP